MGSRAYNSLADKALEDLGDAADAIDHAVMQNEAGDEQPPKRRRVHGDRDEHNGGNGAFGIAVTDGTCTPATAAGATANKLRIVNPETLLFAAQPPSANGISARVGLRSPRSGGEANNAAAPEPAEPAASSKFPVPMFSPRLSPRPSVLPTLPALGSVDAPTPADKLRKHTAIHKAILDGNAAAFGEALAAASAAEVDACDEAGFSALMSAAAAVSPELATDFCRGLVERGADVHTVDLEGYSALHWAAAMGNEGAVRVLVNGGADVHARSCANGDTPLHRAARFGQEACLTVLVTNFGASTTIENKEAESPIDVAGKYCNNRVLVNRIKGKVIKAFYAADPKLKTLILYHDECLEHRTSSVHQEAPERLTAIRDKLARSVEPYTVHETSNFAPATRELLALCHDEKYINFVFDLHKKVAGLGAPVPFTPRVQVMNGVEEHKVKDEGGCDTFFSQGSLPAALRAVGAVVNAVDRVTTRNHRNAFCLVRPPGHHAGVSGLLQDAISCGFCIFNSVAVGAQHALRTYPDKIRKVAIVDFDVHHGNGTEEIVRERFTDAKSVFFFSIHLYDKPKDTLGSGEFYPGSGQKDVPERNVFNAPLVPLWRVPACRTRSKARSRSPINGSAASSPINASSAKTVVPAITGGEVVAAVAAAPSAAVAPRARAPGAPTILAGLPAAVGHPGTRARSRGSSISGSTGGGQVSSAASVTSERSQADGEDSSQGGASSPVAPPKAVYGRQAFRENIEARLLPALAAFEPDLVFISAGFDAGKNDIGCGKTEKGKYFSGIDLLPEDYQWVTREIQKVAQRTCDGRIVSVLEGGYGQWSRSKPAGPGAPRKMVLNRDQLAENAVAHVRGLFL